LEAEAAAAAAAAVAAVTVAATARHGRRCNNTRYVIKETRGKLLKREKGAVWT